MHRLRVLRGALRARRDEHRRKTRGRCGPSALGTSASAASVSASKVVRIDRELCVGCARCIHACPQAAVTIDWGRDFPKLMEKMAEYAAGAIKGKENRSLFINFLTQISPACDCYPYSDAPIVADIGITASRDPVAIDQACVDLLNSSPHLKSSCLKGEEHYPDKIRAVYPGLSWEHQLIHAEEAGIGSRQYELVEVEASKASKK